MMQEAPNTCTVDLSSRLCPQVPAGDSQAAASAVLNDILALAGEWHEQMRAVGNRHLDEAPESSVYVADLMSAIAGTVLDWIERWPS